jgi:hypothetical protein
MERLLQEGMHLRICQHSVDRPSPPKERYFEGLNTISIRLDVPNVWEKPSSARLLVSRFGRRVSNCVSIKIVCYSQKAADQSSDRIIPRKAGFTSCWSRWQSKCNLPWSRRSSVPQGPRSWRGGSNGTEMAAACLEATSLTRNRAVSPLKATVVRRGHSAWRGN